MHELYSCIHFKYTLATANDKEPLHNKSLVVLYHFYLTLLLEEKFTFVEHATIPKIIKKNKTISMMTLFKQPLSVSFDFLC